ncbi:unnamed protein product, partial [Durusdinium trenchii]
TEGGQGGKGASMDQSEARKAASHEWPATVAQWVFSLGRGWFAYIAEFDVWLSLSGVTAIMPQFVTLPLLAGGQGVVNVAALVIQLVAYPLMLGVGALKAQVLQTMVATFIRNPGSEFTETAELIVKALQLSPQKGSQKAVAVEKALVGAFVIGLALAFVFGLKLHADGVNLGVFVGLLEGSLLTTTVFAYVHLLALLAVNLRQVSLYDRLIDDTDLEEVDYKVHLGQGFSALFVMLILQNVSGIVVGYFHQDCFLLVSTAFGTLAAAFGLARIFPKLVRGVGTCPCCSCYSCSMIIYIVTAMIVVVAGLLPGDPNKIFEKSMFSPAPNGSYFDVNHQAPGALAGFGAYPICNNIQWDSPKPTKGSQLTALDLLAFAQAVYIGPRKDIQEELDNATLNTELYPVTIDSIQDTGEVGRVGVFSMSNVKTRVIAIRGSSQAPDWTFNLDVWGPGVFHSFVINAFPFGTLVPVTFATRRLSFDVRGLLGLDHPWVRILKQIQAAKKLSEKDGYNLILTGHSLGGGLAQVLGSLERIPTLVWMPVGGAFTAYRTFGFVINELPLENNIVAVVPWGDLVPALSGSRMVTTQHVGCRARSPIACHSLFEMLCELYRKCGDPRGRDLHATCDKVVGPNWQDIPVKGFVWHTFF